MPAHQPGLVRALLARAGDRWCALPLSRLERVLPIPKIHPLPGARAEVAGLAEVDGEPVVLLSLERLIGAPPGSAPENPVLLLAAAGPAGETETVGLVVDEAGEIVKLDPKRLVGTAQGVVCGETDIGDRLVQVLDLTLLGGTT